MRARELFNEHRRAIFRHTDRMFAVLMAIQWIGGIVIAYWISPRTWLGSSSRTHMHVWAAIFLGGAINLFPIALAVVRPGAATTRHVIATAQMLMSALLIHLSGGRIETAPKKIGTWIYQPKIDDWHGVVHVPTGQVWNQ